MEIVQHTYYDFYIDDDLNMTKVVNKSDQNLSINIPLNPSIQTKDILGNAAQHRGKAGQHLKLVDSPCLLGDGTAYLAFASLPTYDAITVIEDDEQVTISLTSGNWTPTTGKYYNDVIFTNSGVEVAHFTLEDYAPDSSPVSVIYQDHLKTGATATLTSGTVGVGGNLSKCDGLSRLTEKGFNISGDKYIPADPDNPLKDIAGVDLVYKAGNTQSVANKYQFIPSYEAIERDVKFNDDAIEAFTGETANDLNFDDIESVDRGRVTKDDVDNITSLTIKD